MPVISLVTQLEDAARGHRRVVPSPEPIEIVELDVIRSLMGEGVLVVACGLRGEQGRGPVFVDACVQVSTMAWASVSIKADLVSTLHGRDAPSEKG